MAEIRKRDQGIRALQFLCCVLIVFRHANPLDSLGVDLEALIGTRKIIAYHFVQFGTFITDLAVPTFFLISGYLYFSTDINRQIYMRKLKSRIRTLVVPYFIWSSLAFLYFAMLTHIPIVSSHMHMESVSLNLRDVISGILLSKYAPLWYMRYLFAFVVAGIALYQILRFKGLFIIVVAALIIVNLAIGYEYFSLLTWIPFFLVGGGIRRYMKNMQITKSTIVGLFAASIITLIFAYVYENDQSGRILYIYRLISCLAMFFFFESRKDQIRPRWMYDTGMFIYGAHRPIVSTVNKLLIMIIGTGMIGAVAINWITTILVIVLLLVISRFLIRKAPRIWSILNGGR